MSKHRKQNLNLDFQIQYKKYLKGSKENPSKFLPEEVLRKCFHANTSKDVQ